MAETQNEGMGNLPQQPAGEIYTIFTVDPNDRKYYVAAVDSSDEVIVKENTEGSRVFDDLQLWYMVTADEPQQQHKQQTSAAAATAATAWSAAAAAEAVHPKKQETELRPRSRQ